MKNIELGLKEVDVKLKIVDDYIIVVGISVLTQRRVFCPWHLFPYSYAPLHPATSTTFL